MFERAAVTAIAVVGFLAGCGGAASKPLSNTDMIPIDGAQATITSYCIQQIGSTIGRGTGGDLGQLESAVSTLINAYRQHGNVTDPDTRRPFADTLRHTESILGTGNCAPDQATRLEQAITGRGGVTP